MIEETVSRRPLTSRDKAWAKRSAEWLTKKGVRPNAISVASVGFSAIGAAFLILSGVEGARTDVIVRAVILVGVIAGILGRLICNLLDGMVAVEGGLKTASGEIYNDLPDRISDLLLFAGMGYAADAGIGESSLWIQAGWAAAVLAILTAYVRYLGAGCGVGHFFGGPMAKQHRMAVSIGAAAVSAVLEPEFMPLGSGFRIALLLVIAGSVLTTANRVRKIVQKLESQK